MNSKILLALFVVGFVAVSLAQDQDPKQQPSAVEVVEERPERDASFEVETDEPESPRVKRQWGYGGYPYGGGYGGYGYGYRPYRPWGFRRFGYGYYG